MQVYLFKKHDYTDLIICIITVIHLHPLFGLRLRYICKEIKKGIVKTIFIR